MARTEVRGSVPGGENLSSIGNELIEIPHPKDCFSDDPSGRAKIVVDPTPTAQRSSGYVSGQQEKRWIARKSSGSVQEGGLLARPAPIGGAAKQRPRGRATSATVARTELRGPVDGGEKPSSIGHEYVESTHRKNFSEDPSV